MSQRKMRDFEHQLNRVERPTPEEIAARASEVRATWDEATLAKRCVYPPVESTVHKVGRRLVGDQTVNKIRGA